VDVGGRPLLAHLLGDLAAAGAGEVLLLGGTGGERLAAAARSLAPQGLRVETVIEPEPRGTAGALHGVADRLSERFMYLMGDVFTSLDWARLAEAAGVNRGVATLLVHRSSHPEDSDLVITDDLDRVIGWIGSDPARRAGAAAASGPLANAGVAVLNREILKWIPHERSSDLFGQVMPALVDMRVPIFGYRSSEYVKDLGTPQRLRAVREDVEQGRTRRKAELALLDRDGVLNEEAGLISSPDQLRLLPGAAEGLKHLNQAGIRAVVVTNQPVLARGMCSEETLNRIHSRLEKLLADGGARLDGLHFCPHHPETHHSEGVPALRGPCTCRKPAVGMAEKAMAEQGVPPWRTVVIGDRSVDMQLAVNAGLAGIGLETGAGCRDGRCPARPTWNFPDLLAAAKWLF
jgi:mannose-1-phosphate guanylyltransferase/phosphomannomutase